jgi:hypothetical protein
VNIDLGPDNYGTILAARGNSICGKTDAGGPCDIPHPSGVVLQSLLVLPVVIGLYISIIQIQNLAGKYLELPDLDEIVATTRDKTLGGECGITTYQSSGRYGGCPANSIHTDRVTVQNGNVPGLFVLYKISQLEEKLFKIA